MARDVDRELIASIKEGRIEDALLALTQGANPAARDDGWTALMWASDAGLIEVAQALMAAGADPEELSAPSMSCDQTDRSWSRSGGLTALMVASVALDAGMVAALLPLSDANAKCPDGVGALRCVAALYPIWPDESRACMRLLVPATDLSEKFGDPYPLGAWAQTKGYGEDFRWALAAQDKLAPEEDEGAGEVPPEAWSGRGGAR